ncbi:MAG: PilX N-terminal domain-containing pilus assembly protein [Geoalkalibacter sp.]|jgi:Tfp pilus assembly protein PilX|uniref:pilus assembly PilX family protein n=1 Tax=Geoalkalibacter sp. TaxID=3041440 RepID=UPI002A975713|nr:pilus assembly PilX N-terminal domain-containing protein [Thermodesulfobacteriota bacterium]
MQRLPTPIFNQKGAALLTAIMILASLTLLGIASVSGGLVELAIARNNAAHNQAFYQAENGWRHAAAWLAEYPDAPRQDLGSRAVTDPWDQAFVPELAEAPEPVRSEEGRPLFSAAIVYDGMSRPPLFSDNVRALRYRIQAKGMGPDEAVAGIETQLRRLIPAPGY